MGKRRHRHHRLSGATAAVALLFLATAIGGTLIGAVQEGDETHRSSGGAEVSRGQQLVAPGRRRLIGPGSSPPTCRARCGRCAPCRPVRVAIHPGRIVPMDYYPEAWRCKCGSHLFMP
ncbi:hypothetical protein Taro_008711 [Colocasia esculenta]|uniref:Epidermal patterning factor-like protein n=1 Tax=Colocasia esculenta TaxID=4460 RepID=A0A843U487_COLES|nr:hypothetical protein [Colocasia esculenta]